MSAPFKRSFSFVKQEVNLGAREELIEKPPFNIAPQRPSHTVCIRINELIRECLQKNLLVQINKGLVKQLQTNDLISFYDEVSSSKYRVLKALCFKPFDASDFEIEPSLIDKIALAEKIIAKKPKEYAECGIFIATLQKI